MTQSIHSLEVNHGKYKKKSTERQKEQLIIAPLPEQSLL